MRDLEYEPDPSRCWQCGAPADPASEYVQLLNSRPRDHPDAFGECVKRGKWQDAAWVHVPRCATCQTRNLTTTTVAIAAFFIGGAIAGFAFPSGGWTMIPGAFASVIAVFAVVRYYERRRGIRNLMDYPPLRLLMTTGWSTPN